MDLNALLDHEILGNNVGDLLVALGSALALTIVLRVTLNWVLARLRRLSRATETDLDDLFVDLVQRTRTLLIALVAIWVASRPLTLAEGPEAFLRSVLVIGFIAQAGFWGTAILNHLLARWGRGQGDETDPGFATAVGVVGFVLRVALWALLVVTALGTLGLEIGPFIASLGIGGVAIALALQNVLGDLFGSLSIVLDKPFVVGDFIVVGTEMGTVEHVGLKTTRIRSISGEQVVLSNSDVLSSRIRNFGRMQERRIVFPLGVEYGTTPEQLRRIPDIVRTVIEAQPQARFDRCHFKSFGDSSLDFETVYFMRVPEFAVYMDTQQAINLAVFERFSDEGIGFAFPTRTLHVIAEAGTAPTAAGGPEAGAGR